MAVAHRRAGEAGRKEKRARDKVNAMRTRKLKNTVFLLLLSVVFLSMPQVLSAQGGTPTPVQVRQMQSKIDLLMQRIHQAERLLRAFDSEVARAFLDEVKKLQQEIQADFRAKRYHLVQAKISKANTVLDSILALATDSTLKRLITDLHQIMRQAEHEVIGSGNREAERLLKTAKQHQVRAELALRRGNTRQAYEQYTAALTLSRKALDLVRTMCQQEHARFQAMLGRVRHIVEASPAGRARDIYEQALKSFTLAEQACREGRIDLAEQGYNNAFRLMLRAMDLASAGDRANDQQLRTELEALRALLASVRTRFESKSGTGARMILQRIEATVRRAEKFLLEQNYMMARVQLATARRLLERSLVMEEAEPEDVQQRTESTLQQLRAELQQAEQRLGHRELPASFLALARQLAAQAEQDLSAGLYRSAMQKISIAQRFLTRAEAPEQLQRQQVAQTLVDSRIARLEQALHEADAALGEQRPSFVEDLLADARQMLFQARSYRSENKLILALELSNVGIDLVTRALRIGMNQ